MCSRFFAVVILVTISLMSEFSFGSDVLGHNQDSSEVSAVLYVPQPPKIAGAEEEPMEGEPPAELRRKFLPRLFRALGGAFGRSPASTQAQQAALGLDDPAPVPPL